MNNSNRTITTKIDHKPIVFNLSDSDNSDDDNTLNYDIKTNSELLDKLDLSNTFDNAVNSKFPAPEE